VSANPQVSQPNALSGGQTTVVENGTVDIRQGGGGLVRFATGANLAEVVKALNAVGANPLDLINILQAMKAAGALRADLEVI
jgi:flagellar P-ring protein precursor FlgI